VEPFNLASHFVDRHIAEGRGSRTAVVYEGRRYSYAEIAALVNQAGKAWNAATAY
jgi:acyl-coenzyme A synthetase/AMP-(fatty) acid ligase